MQKIIWKKSEKNILRKYENDEEVFQIIQDSNSNIKF
jgi:hypothetical protein